MDNDNLDRLTPQQRARRELMGLQDQKKESVEPDRLTPQQRARRELMGMESPATRTRSSQRDMATAIEWARRKGYPEPEKPWHWIFTLIGIAGLFAAVIPGLAVLGICWWKERNHKKQCDALLFRWIDAGRPDPSDA